MNFWIFTVVDARIGRSLLYAPDIFTMRTKRLYWMLSVRSRNFRRLRRGDRVVFYVGGRFGGKFMGTAVLASDPFRLPPECKRYVIEDPEDRFNYMVNLREVDLFEAPKPVAELAKSLPFITSKKGWWSHLQGSIISISDEDYALIVGHKASP